MQDMLHENNEASWKSASRGFGVPSATLRLSFLMFRQRQGYFGCILGETLHSLKPLIPFLYPHVTDGSAKRDLPHDPLSLTLLDDGKSSKKKRSSQQEEKQNLILEDDLNGCIRRIMGALDDTRQAIAPRDSWTRSAKTL